MRTLISKADITSKLKAEGFDAVGFTTPGAIEPAEARLEVFLAEGRQGDMAWMERPERRSPSRIFPEARSVLVVAMNYGPEDDPLPLLTQRTRGNISVYARNRDYHDIMKKRLKAVGRWLGETTGEPLKIFVDTAPVMEKPFAQAAGLGWQGKHTNLVSRDLGSWFFLGLIFTAVEFAPDDPMEDHCGSCRRCLDICPTDAFPAPYQLDARRCISYLTIEHKGPIPMEFRAKMGNRIYGCDDCLAVCPWNKFAQDAREAGFHAREELKSPALTDLVQLDDPAFRALFTKSPVKRVGRDRFIRNVLIAIANSGSKLDLAEAVPNMPDLLADLNPLVRGAAVWALSRLADTDEFNRTRLEYEFRETDPDVMAEWSVFN